MSDAADNLAIRQRGNPPLERRKGDPTDWARMFYDMLEPNLPQWARELHRAGRLVIGEIGLHRPDGYNEPFNDGSYAIVLTSGYIRLFQAVASDFCAAINLLRDGTQVEPLLSISDFAMRNAALLGQYRDGHLFSGHALDTYLLRLRPEQQSWAKDLATLAGLLVFAHELGHVSIRVNDPANFTNPEEQEADHFAFLMLLATAQRLNLASTYTGALFALRLHACLERSGFKFTHVNAPFTKRVEWLKGDIRTNIARDWIAPQDFAWAEVWFEQLLGPVEQTLLYMSTTSADNVETAENPSEVERNHKTEAAPRTPTLAAAELEKLQLQFPPWEWSRTGNPIDRSKRLTELATPILPGFVHRMLASGTLVIGEVGLNDPASSLRRFNDGSSAIILNSGLLSLLQAVSRFLHTRVAVRLSSHQVVGCLAPHQTTVWATATLLRDLAQKGFSPQSLSFALPGIWQPSTPTFLDPVLEFLHEEQLALAYDLEAGAGVFILASHAMESMESKAELQKTGLEHPGEGLTALLFAHCVPSLGFRRSYAGALFATHMVSLLESLLTSPPPRTRRSTPVKLAPWRLCGSTAAQEYLITVGNAYDAIMESVEAALCGAEITAGSAHGSPLVIDKSNEDKLWVRDCIAWWIAGGIYQCRIGEERPERVLELMIQWTRGLSEDLLIELFDSLFDRVHLKVNVTTPADRESALQGSDILNWLIDHLPGLAQSTGRAVLRKKNSSTNSLR